MRVSRDELSSTPIRAIRRTLGRAEGIPHRPLVRGRCQCSFLDTVPSSNVIENVPICAMATVAATIDASVSAIAVAKTINVGMFCICATPSPFRLPIANTVLRQKFLLTTDSGAAAGGGAFCASVACSSWTTRRARRCVPMPSRGGYRGYRGHGVRPSERQSFRTGQSGPIRSVRVGTGGKPPASPWYRAPHPEPEPAVSVAAS
jgi:hypothetical protein